MFEKMENPYFNLKKEKKVFTHFKTCKKCGLPFVTQKKYSKKCNACLSKSRNMCSSYPRFGPGSIFKRFKL